MKRVIFLSVIFFFFLADAQVNGRVVNSKNEGIPFASVLVKNTTVGTTADSTGAFSITRVTEFPLTLVVTYAGFEPEQKVVRGNNASNIIIRLQQVFQTDTIVITSRRRRELLQDVPIAVSVIGGAQIDNVGAFNVNRIKELIPSVQLYSSNPRNTGLNIRGLGSSFGLTNDGVDPGVGLYIDGVYFARPAATVGSR